MEKGKRRTWRKVHLGFDEETGEVTAYVLTEKDMLPTLLDEVNETIDQVSGDGGYDFKTCYDAIAERGAKAVIPPRKSAIFHNNGFMDTRDDNLRRIQEIGREAWKRESGYHPVWRQIEDQCGQTVAWIRCHTGHPPSLDRIARTIVA